jgi:hypothetical protein
LSFEGSQNVCLVHGKGRNEQVLHLPGLELLQAALVATAVADEALRAIVEHFDKSSQFSTLQIPMWIDAVGDVQDIVPDIP